MGKKARIDKIRAFMKDVRALTTRSVTPDDEPYIRSEMMKFTPLYLIAEDLGIGSDALRKYVRRYMGDVLLEMREAMKDVAEAKMMENIKSGNENAIEFFLDRQAKDRGYGEQVMIPQSSLPVINIGRIEVKECGPKKSVEVVSVSPSPLEPSQIEEKEVEEK